MGSTHLPPRSGARPRRDSADRHGRRRELWLAVVRRDGVVLCCGAAVAALMIAGQAVPCRGVLQVALAVLAVTCQIRGTVRHQWLAEASRLSRTDDLTGLANRRALLASLREGLINNWPVTLILLDLDGFKEINDRYGHEVGDQVLQAVATRLNGAAQPSDMTARLGGDEFAVLTRNDLPVAALDHGHTLRASLGRPLDVASVSLKVDASVGIAIRDAGDRAVADLLRRADVALYQAKGGVGVVLHTVA
jgi:diguanylate cyclase (GGDEF)-like protein